MWASGLIEQVGDDKQTFNALIWWARGEEEISCEVSAGYYQGWLDWKPKAAHSKRCWQVP